MADRIVVVLLFVMTVAWSLGFAHLLSRQPTGYVIRIEDPHNIIVMPERKAK